MKMSASVKRKLSIPSPSKGVRHDRRGQSEGSRRHRWPKGRSGNPRGRREGSRNFLAVVKEVALEKVKVRLGGKVRKITRAEYMFRMNYNAAVQKRNPKAMDNMLLLVQVAGHLVDREDLKRRGVPIEQSQPLTMDEFEELFGQLFDKHSTSNASED